MTAAFPESLLSAGIHFAINSFVTALSEAAICSCHPFYFCSTRLGACLLITDVLRPEWQEKSNFNSYYEVFLWDPEKTNDISSFSPILSIKPLINLSTLLSISHLHTLRYIFFLLSQSFQPYKYNCIVTQKACRAVVAGGGDVPPSNSCHTLTGDMSKPERGEEQFKAARDSCESKCCLPLVLRDTYSVFQFRETCKWL